jgi:hypothetical protein
MDDGFVLFSSLLIKRQLEELQRVRGLNYKPPDFKIWRDTTTRVLQMFLGPALPQCPPYTVFAFLKKANEAAQGKEVRIGGGQECPPHTSAVITLRDGSYISAIFACVGARCRIVCRGCVCRISRMVDAVAKFRAEFVEPCLVVGDWQSP